MCERERRSVHMTTDVKLFSRGEEPQEWPINRLQQLWFKGLKLDFTLEH